MLQPFEALRTTPGLKRFIGLASRSACEHHVRGEGVLGARRRALVERSGLYRSRGRPVILLCSASGDDAQSVVDIGALQHAAVGLDFPARDPAGLVADEDRNDVTHIVRLAEATQRCHADDLRDLFLRHDHACVSVVPGDTALTVMPRAPSPFARLSARCSPAAFDAAYNPIPGIVIFLSPLENWTIRPPSAIRLAASLRDLHRAARIDREDVVDVFIGQRVDRLEVGLAGSVDHDVDLAPQPDRLVEHPDDVAELDTSPWMAWA